MKIPGNVDDSKIDVSNTSRAAKGLKRLFG